MKIRVFEKHNICTFDIADESIKQMLLDKNISSFKTEREKIVDIPLADIFLPSKEGKETGYSMSNKLYDIIHKEHKLYANDADLEYEIKDESYPFLNDIPYCNKVINTIEEFNQWLLHGIVNRVAQNEAEMSKEDNLPQEIDL